MCEVCPARKTTDGSTFTREHRFRVERVAVGRGCHDLFTDRRKTHPNSYHLKPICGYVVVLGVAEKSEKQKQITLRSLYVWISSLS